MRRFAAPALALLLPLAAPAAPGSAPLPPPASAPAPLTGARELAQLGARAEIAFKQGMERLDAGKDDEARAAFDGALDLYLNAGPAARAEPGYAPAFESLAGRIAAAELAAAAADSGGPADADAAPAPGEGEPTPGELALNAPPVLLTPEEAARLQETSAALLREQSSDLPIVLNDETLKFVKFYTGTGHDAMQGGLNRSGRYLEMMRGEFAAAGLPRDLVWIALVESSFKPEAYSYARARGVWQFIASSGKLYGLRIDDWVDERSDPRKAVRAAARYFKDLHDQLGDWPSAIAAYNCGAGRILKARRKTRKTDFFALARTRWIPQQTRDYVPIIMAAVLITKDPARYGFKPEPEAPVATEDLPVTGPLRLASAAAALGLPEETLRALNPELIVGLVPPGPYPLQVPVGLAAPLRQAAAAIPVEQIEPPAPPPEASWARIHRVRRGETLARVARRYRTTVELLARANGLRATSALRAGMRLRVPGGGGRGKSRGGPAYARGQRIYHVVRRGESLAGIAARYKTTAAAIGRWNGVSGNPAAGRRLVVYYGVK